MEGVVIDPAFWRGRRVFVTGHTGFKGGWLCAWLRQLGAKVAGYALAPDTEPSFFAAAQVKNGMRSTIADIRRREPLAKAMRAHAPEVVFHMAAQALVRRSYAAPVETFDSNVMGTISVLEAVRRCPSVRVVVVITSDKCYENREHARGYRESDRLGGRDPYSASKACAEIATQAWRLSFFGERAAPAIASVRAGNVLGGGDWAQDRLLPDIVRALAAKSAPRIRNPRSVRPWQHVLDALAGYLVLAERLHRRKGRFEGAWNFGPSARDARSVRWIADTACRLWSEGARWKPARRSRGGHEAKLLSLDARKARRELRWQPRLSPEDALAWTVDWYKAYQRDPASGRRITEEQIARFSRGQR